MIWYLSILYYDLQQQKKWVAISWLPDATTWVHPAIACRLPLHEAEKGGCQQSPQLPWYVEVEVVFHLFSCRKCGHRFFWKCSPFRCRSLYFWTVGHGFSSPTSKLQQIAEWLPGWTPPTPLDLKCEWMGHFRYMHLKQSTFQRSSHPNGHLQVATVNNKALIGLGCSRSLR